MTDAVFEDLLKKAVIRTAEIKYLSNLPPEEELPEPSEHFQRRMSKLIHNPEKYIKNYKRPVYLRILQRVAVIILVVSVLFSASMLHPTVRATVVNFVKTWFDDHTEYKVVGDSTSVIPMKVEFGYIPEGYTLEAENYDSLRVSIIYRADENKYLVLEIMGSQINANLDNEHMNHFTALVKDTPVDVYESLDETYPSILLMYDEENNFYLEIMGFTSITELITVLEQCKY